MIRVKRKPLDLWAIKISDENMEEIRKIPGVNIMEGEKYAVSVQTVEGRILASMGDWILREADGNTDTCSDRTFQRMYEIV